jgi:hypothetical protein
MVCDYKTKEREWGPFLCMLLMILLLIFPCSQHDGIAEVFFLGCDTAAAFANEFGVSDQMSVLIRVLFMYTLAVKFAEMLIVIFT